MPPPIFITPKLAKYINEKKEGKFALQNEITELEAQVKKLEDKKAVKENDKSEMIRKMDMGNLVKDQLKKHKNNIQDMINKYSTIIQKIISLNFAYLMDIKIYYTR